MNRRTAKRKLDLSKPLYTRRRLSTHGEEFGPRELLPWERLGLRKATLETWFRQRVISHDPMGDGYDQRLTNSDGERLDGPTIEEWVKAGYGPTGYPPPGWAIKHSPGLDYFREHGEMPEGIVSELGRPAPSPEGVVVGDQTDGEHEPSTQEESSESNAVHDDGPTGDQTTISGEESTAEGEVEAEVGADQEVAGESAAATELTTAPATPKRKRGR